MPSHNHLALRTRLACFAAILVVVGWAASDAFAQRPTYRDRPEAYNRDSTNRDRSGREHQPGVFDYYLLALSWSPTYCADRGEERGSSWC